MILALALLALFPPQPGAGTPDPTEERPARTVGDLVGNFPGPQDGFMIRLQSLCTGDRYEGRVTSDDPEDEAMRAERLVIGPAECRTDEAGRLLRAEVPFAVGEDESRTWIVSRVGGGVRLRHEHLASDGTEDAVSGYGGQTASEGTFTQQAFPADAESRALFEAEGIPASAQNVWALEVVPGDSLAYELERPGRAFRAEFDLARPLPRSD